MNRIIRSLIVLAILLAAGCTIHKEHIQQELLSSKWKLESIAGDTAAISSFKNAYIQLAANGRVLGFVVCNTIKGSYELSGTQQIYFKHINLSWLGCRDRSQQEYQFTALLSKVNRYQYRRGILILYRDKEKLLSFRK